MGGSLRTIAQGQLLPEWLAASRRKPRDLVELRRLGPF